MRANENPFAPPSHEAEIGSEEAQDDEPLRNASQSTRFVNFLVDSVCRSILAFATGFMGAMLGEAGAFLMLFWLFGYHLFFEFLFSGKTPGKWLTNTHVVRVDGGRPRFTQILGRTLARYVPFEPFSFFGKAPVGWHDSWSGTRVVRDSR